MMLSNSNNSRFNSWFATVSFSIIAMVSLVNDWDGNIGDQTKEVKWSVSAIIISVGLAGLAVLAHIVAKDKFVGTKVEWGTATVVVGIWAAGLATIMKPSNNIATTGDGTINAPNLFFFSWFAFFFAVYTKIHYIQNVLEVGLEGLAWIALTVSSLVAMSSSSRLYKDLDCDDDGSDRCNRTEFAVWLSVATAVVAFVWSIVGSRLPKIAGGVSATIMLAAWCFGVSFITFGGEEKAPAHDIGTLYFAAWGSFVLSCSIFAESAMAVINEREEKSEESADGEEAAPEEDGAQKDVSGPADEETGHEEE